MKRSLAPANPTADVYQGGAAGPPASAPRALPCEAHPGAHAGPRIAETRTQHCKQYPLSARPGMMGRMDPVALLQGVSSLVDRGRVRRLVPAAALVFLVASLLVSGAPAHAPSILRVIHWADRLNVVDLSLLLLLIAATSIFLQPLLRYGEAVIEGTAPVGPLLNPIKRILINRKRYKLVALEAHYQELAERRVKGNINMDEEEEFAYINLKLSRSPTRYRMAATALGNLLRAADEYPLYRYGLDLRVALPRLLQLLPKEARASFEGQQDDLQFAVNFVVVLALGALISTALLARDGLWLFLPVILFALAFLAYNNALTAAAEYGEAERVLFDLYRFRLYQKLNLRLPTSSEEERHLGRELTRGLWVGFENTPYIQPFTDPTEEG